MGVVGIEYEGTLLIISLHGQTYELHFVSCTTCAKVNKGDRVLTAVIEHPVLSYPFKVRALDIVSTLTPENGGMHFILTSCCMATRWPGAIPLKTAT